jgi:hypothetical protein
MKMLLQILAAMKEWERERREWERNGQHKLALTIDVKMRRGRHSFILGREERPLLDELEVAFIQGKEDKVKEGALLGFWRSLGFEG